MQTVPLYSLLWLAGARPQLAAELFTDMVMFALTLAAGIELLSSSYKGDTRVKDSYNTYGTKTGCGELSTAVWCTFLSMATFAVAIFLSFASEKILSTKPRTHTICN